MCVVGTGGKCVCGGGGGGGGCSKQRSSVLNSRIKYLSRNGHKVEHKWSGLFSTVIIFLYQDAAGCVRRPPRRRTDHLRGCAFPPSGIAPESLRNRPTRRREGGGYLVWKGVPTVVGPLIGDVAVAS